MLNVKNNAEYSDKFILSVVNLKHINLADLAVLEECEVRQQYYRDQQRLSRLEQETVEKDKTIDTLNTEIQKLRELLAQNHISV